MPKSFRNWTTTDALLDTVTGALAENQPVNATAHHLLRDTAFGPAVHTVAANRSTRTKQPEAAA